MVTSVLRSSLLTSLLVLSSSLFVSYSTASPVSNPLHDAQRRQDSWPYGPFTVDGPEMKNARGDPIVYAGANWPGHGEVMIPDGLSYQSIESIVAKMKSVGMNAVRLTYAIQMIDEIYDHDGRDTTVREAFTAALGAANGPARYRQFLAQNPAFGDNTTRLQVFDAVAAECARQEIHVHLDNHMSRAAWCCSTTDGNAWPGDRDFDADRWLRGLAYMADRGRAWPALTSMSLRNEPRAPDGNAALKAQSYNWRDWYGFARRASRAVHDAHDGILILLSGLDFDTWVTPLVQGTALTPGRATFAAADFEGYADKLVLEIHNYQNDAASCAALESTLYEDGFQGMRPGDAGTANVFPVVLSEFGFAMAGDEWKRPYASCIAGYLKELKAGWFIWVLAGSYYVRSGTQDYDEAWGLLDHEWKDWRSPAYVDGGLRPLVEATAQG